MRKFIRTALLSLAVLGVPLALASEPTNSDANEAEATENADANATEAPAEADADAAPDCTALEGEEKTKCEAAAAATEAPEAAEAPAKGGKAKRSNTNRMEAEATDE